MIRSHRTDFATFLIFCLLLAAIAAVPALAADDGSGSPTDPSTQVAPAQSEPAEQSEPATEPPSAAPAEPAPAEPSADATDPDPAEPVDPDPSEPADPTDPTTGGGSTSPTGPTDPTGSTDPTGPVTDGTDTPTTDGQAPPATGSGTQPPAGSNEDKQPTADGTITEDDSGSRPQSNSDVRGTDATGTQDVINQLSAPTSAGDSGLGAAAGRSAQRATDQIERNAESGVAATLVVTRIISEVPAWVFWALAGLGLVALAGLGLYVRERLRRRSAEHEALVDELTGISNRKAFDRRLDLEWRRAARYGRSLGLMVMDLDGFKQVNDVKGHAAGDRVLREVAQALDGRMRDTDLVARIGGDEFAIICPETGINELMTVRRQLSDQVTGSLKDPVGLSIGVAEFVPSDEDATSILARADESMYRVKRGEQTALPA